MVLVKQSSPGLSPKAPSSTASNAGGSLFFNQRQRPCGGATRGDRGSLDLVELLQGLKARDLSTPILIRFDDILEDRLERLHAAFERAIAHYAYDASYQGCFDRATNSGMWWSIWWTVATAGISLEAGAWQSFDRAFTPGILMPC